MNSKYEGGITIRVRKGANVKVEEGGDVRDDDSRVPDDRDIIIVGPKDIKVAIKALDAQDVSARADLTLRCG